MIKPNMEEDNQSLEPDKKNVRDPAGEFDVAVLGCLKWERKDGVWALIPPQHSWL